MRNFPDPRGYWSDTEGRRAVEAWRRSGESAAAFGRRHGVRAKRLVWWSKRLPAPSTIVSLVPATVVETEPDELAVVIRVPGGIAIEIESATPTSIAAIVTALARSSS
jgi:hypothetical protein